MNIKLYENANEYLEEHESVLLEHESISQLLLFSAHQNLDNDDKDTCLFGVIQEENRPILHFCNVLPHNMDLFTVNSSVDEIEEATGILAAYFVKRQITIKGLLGTYNVCQSFIEHYKKMIPCTFIEKQVLDLMELREVNEITLALGEHRLAKEEEIKLIASWIVNFQIESFSNEVDYETSLKKATNLIRREKCFLYEDGEGNIVSMAAASRQLIHGIMFNYIYTPTEYRGMGYAATNLYHMSKRFLEDGNEFCTLFVDKRNQLSLRSYEKIGYHILDEIYEYNILLT